MFDRENMFSMKQALTATAVSTDTVFVGEGDAGPGQDLILEIDATKNTGGASLAVAVQTADDAAMTTPVVLATFTIAAAVLAKGGPVLAAPLPPGMKRFLRLNYTVTGTPVGLSVTSGIVLAGQTNK